MTSSPSDSSSTTDAPTRWRLVVEYDGTDFAGWQLQPNARTIQGDLEQALARLLDHPVRVSPSGRTDAGVHALGQVATFTTAAPRSEKDVRDGLNALLPPDVSCVEAARVPMAFHPRHWAWSKAYRYRYLDRAARSPLRRHRVWHVRQPLDVGAMAEGAAFLVGRHDLSSFRASGCAAAHPNRTIEALEVTRRGDEVHLDARGQGFLRHTVRIIAGTLHEVGRGARQPAWVATVLQARDRAAAARTAPPGGLTLMRVQYGDGPPPWHLDGDESGA